MTTAEPDDVRSDAEVDAEWRHIEAERIAQERAEAREDVDAVEIPHPPATSLPRWQVIAMVVALAAGVAMAFLLNRSRPTPAPMPPAAQRSPSP